MISWLASDVVGDPYSEKNYRCQAQKSAVDTFFGQKMIVEIPSNAYTTHEE